MPISRPDFDRIDESDLQELRTNEVAEGIAVEYKRETYTLLDADKREFRKDVSSFSNTAGGHIIIGMAATGGLPTELVGVEHDLDAEMLRLESLLRDKIEPRIAGIRMLPVRLANGRRALVIRIPKSWNPPHAVLQNTSRLIFKRNSAGVHEASVDEMRTMFTAGATLLDRSREFHRGRMQEVHSGDGPGPIAFGGEGGRMLLHVIPFSAFSSETSLDLTLVSRAFLPPIWCSGADMGYNADGFYTVSAAVTVLSGYTQVFRNSIIESAAGDVRAKVGQKFVLYASEAEREIAHKIERYMTVLSNAGVSPPMFVLLSGIRMHGTMVAADRPIAAQPSLRKSDLVLPAITLEAYGAKKDYCRALKPIFDAIWNAAGYAASPNYGPDGSWIGGA